ncbi:hypothetical protein Q8G50_32610, partial [Klebsiella pneumoniae]
DRLITPKSDEWATLSLPRESMGIHLCSYAPGGSTVVEYQSNDPRLPASVREFNRAAGVHSIITAPLALGTRNLGWIAVSTLPTPA